MTTKDQKCPGCGWGGAYHGAISVECVNTECSHYSPKLYKETWDKINKEQNEPKRVAEYEWLDHHIDLGDC